MNSVFKMDKDAFLNYEINSTKKWKQNKTKLELY